MTSHTPLARHIAPRIDEARLTRQLALIRARLGPEGSRARVFGFAVAFAAVAAVGMLVYRMRAPVDLADASALALFETHSAGERVTIAGRAALVLDAESRLRVGSVSRERVRLELERGGVELDVAPRAEQSLEVGAAGYVVRVVGTQFDVRFVAPARLSVSVTHGRVEVRNEDDGELVRTLGTGESWSTILPPGVAQRAVVQPSEVSTTPAPSAAEAEPAAEPSPPSIAKPAESSPVHAARGESAREIFERAQRARASGRTAESAAAFRELRARYPNDPRAALAAFELGRLELEMHGDPKQASKALEEAARSAPEGSALREDAEARRIDALDAAGDVPACLTAQRAYVARYPNSVHRARVLSRCRKP